jgi:hypothetical protein
MKKVIRLTESDIESLVNKIIKEEGEDMESPDQQDTENQDNPKDVERFLELADKYLFDKYGKYAEKINTIKEKAMLIAALAKKWGVEASELGRVKSVLNTESVERIDEIGYDSPAIMAQHAGSMMGALRSMYDDLINLLERMSNNVEAPKEMHIKALSKLTIVINEMSRMLRDLSPEMESPLKEESERFADVLTQFENRIRILSNMGINYTNQEFSDKLQSFLIRVTSAMMRFGKSIIEIDKKLTQRFTGRDRGEYGG